MTNLDKQRDELAWKYGDERGGTASTKQGSYAYTDFSSGFSACEKILSERIAELKSALRECIGWSTCQNPEYEPEYIEFMEALGKMLNE